MSMTKKQSKGKKQNEMTDEHIDEVLALYSDRKTVEKESYLASFEDIEKNDFNLNIPRYVDNFEKEEDVDINTLLQDMKKTDDELEQVKGDFVSLLKDLTSPDQNIIFSSLYEVFQTDNYVNDRFLWHWLKSDEFPRWIEKLQEGSVRLYFYYDKLCECQLYMPSLEEQEKIATFLDDLDHLITLHQHKCEELQNIKKFMLKNMFI